jgi:hypothetical protein
MDTAPQLEHKLSDVALLLQQQKYEDALAILGDLIEKNPTDRETRMYRLLAVRILVLHHSLSRPTIRSAKSLRDIGTVITKAAWTLRTSEFHKMAWSFIRGRKLAQAEPGNRDSQSPSEVAQLNEEIANLKNQLQMSEARRSQELADLDARLQIEITELKQQLEESQAKSRALEAVQQQLANVESREMMLREQKDALEVQLAELQQELHLRKEKLEELDATRTRLIEMEQVSNELRGENLRLQAEILGWKERRENTQRQASAFEGQLAELPNATQSSADSTALVKVVNDEGTKPAVWSSRKGRSRLAIIPATGVVAIASALVLGFLGISSKKFSGPEEPVVALQAISSEESTSASQPLQTPVNVELPLQPPTEDSVKPPKRPSPASVTRLAKTATSKPRPAVETTPRLTGIFETTREAELYNGPSEESALIASIRPGMKINVVDSRDGWLEVRSKHGRPSGFVRQEAAVKVDQN